MTMVNSSMNGSTFIDEQFTFRRPSQIDHFENLLMLCSEALPADESSHIPDRRRRETESQSSRLVRPDVANKENQ